MPLAALELTDVVLASGGVVQIPKFVADACQRILEQVETEGLFRKAGSANRQKEIRVRIGKRILKNWFWKGRDSISTLPGLIFLRLLIFL